MTFHARTPVAYAAPTELDVNRWTLAINMALLTELSGSVGKVFFIRFITNLILKSASGRRYLVLPLSNQHVLT